MNPLALLAIRAAAKGLRSPKVRTALKANAVALRGAMNRGTDLVMVFPHPEPAFATHFIIAPKVPVRTLQELGRSPRLLAAVFEAAAALAAKSSLDRDGYSVVVNGGSRRDLEQIHFQLTAGAPVPSP